MKDLKEILLSHFGFFLSMAIFLGVLVTGIVISENNKYKKEIAFAQAGLKQIKEQHDYSLII